MNFTTKADELYDVRVALLLGNYEAAIADVQHVATQHGRGAEAEALRADKTALTALAYVGLDNFAAAHAELSRATPHPHVTTLTRLLEVLEALRTHNNNNSSNTAAAAAVPSDKREYVQSRIDALVADAAAAHDVRPETTYLVKYAAMALLEDRNNNSSSSSSSGGDHGADYTSNCLTALRLCQRWLQRLPPQPASPQAEVYTLELHAFVVEALLSVHCVDEAQAQVQRMYALNDMAPHTLLAASAVALCAAQRLLASHEAYVQALDILQGVQLQYGQSTRVLNLMALAHMGLSDFAAAERVLLDALALRAHDAVTLANLATASAQLGKANEAVERYVRQATQPPPTTTTQQEASSSSSSATTTTTHNVTAAAARAVTARVPAVCHANVRQYLDAAVAQFAAMSTTAAAAAAATSEATTSSSYAAA